VIIKQNEYGSAEALCIKTGGILKSKITPNGSKCLQKAVFTSKCSAYSMVLADQIQYNFGYEAFFQLCN